ncbi:MAG TPA: hypothetical protein VN224_04390, partial [Xanthomonadales bacterium]|nr:hypothetical protein [Xanthomonadales bacterium]
PPNRRDRSVRSQSAGIIVWERFLNAAHETQLAVWFGRQSLVGKSAFGSRFRTSIHSAASHASVRAISLYERNCVADRMP